MGIYMYIFFNDYKDFEIYCPQISEAMTWGFRNENERKIILSYFPQLLSVFAVGSLLTYILYTNTYLCGKINQ